MIKYMHTIDGHPAEFLGDQITYAIKRRPILLVNSLSDIMRECRQTSAWRKRKGFYNDAGNYGHLRVKS